MGNPRAAPAGPGSAAARPATDGGGTPSAVRRRLGRDQRARGRVRLRRPARRRRPASRSTPRSASSATSGTARSSRASLLGHARPLRAGRRSRCWASRRTTCRPLGELDRAGRSTERRRRRRVRIGRRAPCSTAAGDSPLAVLARRGRRAAARVLARLSPTPAAASRAAAAGPAASRSTSYHALERDPAIGEALRAAGRARPAGAARDGRDAAVQAAVYPLGVGRA